MRGQQRDRHSLEIPVSILSLVQEYTKSTPERLRSMYAALRLVDEEGVEGDVVECGVWRGGNIMLARIMSPERTCWLYDTFEGMTEPDHELDVKRDGERAIDRYLLKKRNGGRWNAVSVEDVKDSFRKMRLADNCKFVIGPVEDTVLHQSPEKISILRLDVDWHAPTKAALENLYHKLSPGGFLIVDDYGHWMGCKKAVDDFFGDDKPVMAEVDYSCVMFQR